MSKLFVSLYLANSAVHDNAIICGNDFVNVLLEFSQHVLLALNGSLSAKYVGLWYLVDVFD